MTERRSIVRKKSFLKGRVYFNHGLSSMDCVIREFTSIGARLEFFEIPMLPERFEVFIPAKDQYFKAQGIWHKGCKMGVAWWPEGAFLYHQNYDRSGDPIPDRVAKLEHEVALLRKQLGALVETG